MSSDCRGNSTISSTAEDGSQNASSSSSSCVLGKCVCATGRLGTHCTYTADWLLNAARARARREQERVRGLHLCLSVWRGGEAGADGGAQELEDGAPLVFALCRRRMNAHQRWAGEKKGGGNANGAFKISSERKAGLCWTVPPLA